MGLELGGQLFRFKLIHDFLFDSVNQDRASTEMKMTKIAATWPYRGDLRAMGMPFRVAKHSRGENPPQPKASQEERPRQAGSGSGG
jgi:hypothetical protein